MNIKMVFALASVTVLLAVAVGMPALRSSSAQTEVSQKTNGILAACEPGQSVIEASELLLNTSQTSRKVIEKTLCPVGDRLIVDNGVGNYMPPLGESVSIETYGPDGATQEFKIVNRKDVVLLEHVGDESNPSKAFSTYSGNRTIKPGSPAPCADATNPPEDGYLVNTPLEWYFNRSSTPSELIPDNALNAILDAGVNIVNVRNDCGIPDNASAPSPRYQGSTSTYADINDDQGYNRCGTNDGRSEVSFGDMGTVYGQSYVALAAQCDWNNGEVSDIKFNKQDYFWTAQGEDDAQCNDGISGNNPWGLEAVATHERGHTYGMGHLSENKHANLTMSTIPNGPCQSQEATLGKGDAQEMNERY